MGIQNACISVKKKGQRKCLKKLSFSLPKKSFSVSQTLMCEFKDLSLSNEEKGKLSRNHRENMCTYLHFSESEVENYKKELIKTLHDLSDEAIIVQATEMGAFICLAAIFSGELPHNVNWRFEFEEFSPQLFPKKLIKKKSAAQAYEISLAFSQRGWIRPFPSLCKVPSYMPLNSPLDHEELVA